MTTSKSCVCPVCKGKLVSFRQMFLRTMYWYYECETRPGHYRWPGNRYGYDTPEALEAAILKASKVNLWYPEI